ncbi:MAG: M23 family metallopeptidase [Mariprofundaceae bacterium]|nr:M23 family metallopeptidase [Mariprofundaceae bacterium]
MAIALRVICLIGILALTACYKTELPYQHSKPSYSKQDKSGHYSTYRVRKGDTLYSIGKRFGIDHKLLARRNHIRYPYTIYVGQRLSLTRTAAKPQYMPIPRASAKKERTVTGKPSKSTKRAVPGKAVSSHSRAAVNGSVKLRWPINAKVTSRFGRRGSRMHDGIDIGAKEGTPVHAAAAGEVVYSDQRLSGYGKLIIIRHSSDMFTAYAHNQRNLVRKGNRVKAGDVIARVGRTGRASGPHLHFEVRRGPTPVDPLVYLPRR